jgi:dTDP-4-dehydrorhamnose reductase
MSTDAVFDGDGGWYREQDLPRPIHPYGKAKLESEHIVAASETAANSLAVILRLSLVWGLDPIDPRTLYIRECLARKTPLVLYDDEYRCPARVDQLATAILELCGLEFSGVLHLAGPERLNRYQFGLLLARNQGWAESGISKGPSTLSGTVRPRDCSLDSSLARRLLKTKLSAPSDLL